MRMFKGAIWTNTGGKPPKSKPKTKKVKGKAKSLK